MYPLLVAGAASRLWEQAGDAASPFFRIGGRRVDPDAGLQFSCDRRQILEPMSVLLCGCFQFGSGRGIVLRPMSWTPEEVRAALDGPESPSLRRLADELIVGVTAGRAVLLASKPWLRAYARDKEDDVQDGLMALFSK